MRTQSPIRSYSVLLFFALTLLLVTPTTAQSPPTMVADIGLEHVRQSWESTEFLRIGGALYFRFDDGVHGTELWRTDLTLAGTRMILDACPGACGTRAAISLQSGFEVLGPSLVFAGTDGIHGTELWVSDGSAAGTSLLVDLRPGLAASNPSSLVASGGLVYFVADDGVHGYALWRTDGSAAGTWRIAAAPAGEFPWPRRGAQNGLFFSYERAPVTGLWWTDGSPGSATQVYAGAVGSAAVALGDGTMLFAGDRSLWRSDGTVEGTELVKQLAPPASSPEFPENFELVGNNVFFTDYNGSQLWRSDGTAAGTFQVPLPAGVSPAVWTAHGHVGGRFFFRATDGVHGNELWTLDGLSPRLVSDIASGPADSFSYPGGKLFLGLGSRLLFVANDGAHGAELWTSDSAGATASLLADLEPGPPSIELESRSFDSRRDELAGRLPFVRFTPDLGFELWATDGTPAGTGVVAPLTAAPSGLPAAYQPALWSAAPMLCRADLRGRLLFDANDGTSGRQPWVSDGSALGTAALGEPGSWPSSCTVVNGIGLFGAGLASSALWRTDGSPAGTAPVIADGRTVPFFRGFYGPLVSPLPVLGDFAYFYGGGLRRSNGTTAERLFDHPGSMFWPMAAPVAGGRLVYFGEEYLARTDGTLAGSFALGSSAGEGHNPRSLATNGEQLFYLASDDAYGEEPWTSDGTVEGTHRIADLNPGPASATWVDWWEGYEERPIAVARGLAFFAADDGVHGEELWVSDGTAEGTHLFDLFPGADPSSPREITTYGREVFFVAEDPAAGRELWRSDGTVAGTRLVRDLLPGAGSSLPQSLAVVDDRLFFSACLPARGCEPWVFDRSTAGPSWAATFDLAPGALSSSPHSFTFAGGRVYFAANDNLHGFELWSMPARGLFSDGFESGNPLTWSAGGP